MRSPQHAITARSRSVVNVFRSEVPSYVPSAPSCDRKEVAPRLQLKRSPLSAQHRRGVLFPRRLRLRCDERVEYPSVRMSQ